MKRILIAAVLALAGCGDARHPATYIGSEAMEKKQVGILCMHIVAKEGIDAVKSDAAIKFACMDYLGN